MQKENDAKAILFLQEIKCRFPPNLFDKKRGSDLSRLPRWCYTIMQLFTSCHPCRPCLGHPSAFQACPLSSQR